jgi:hypothetical protein
MREPVITPLASPEWPDRGISEGFAREDIALAEQTGGSFWKDRESPMWAVYWP